MQLSPTSQLPLPHTGCDCDVDGLVVGLLEGIKDGDLVDGLDVGNCVEGLDDGLDEGGEVGLGIIGESVGILVGSGVRRIQLHAVPTGD